jgi:hypothetical protein
VATKDISDLQVCKAYQQYRDKGYQWPYELLEAETGQPFKVCWAAMERACDRGYVEFGVNLRGGWLTDAGKALLGEASGR